MLCTTTVGALNVNVLHHFSNRYINKKQTMTVLKCFELVACHKKALNIHPGPREYNFFNGEGEYTVG